MNSIEASAAELSIYILNIFLNAEYIYYIYELQKEFFYVEDIHHP